MKQVQYKEPKTFVFPGMVVRVCSPVLESREREKRMKAIHKATEKIFKGVTK